MNPKLKEKTMESLAAVLPITCIMLVLSVLLVPMRLDTVALFLAGALMLVLGMGLFQLGTEITMTPLGRGIGVQISKTRRRTPVVLLAFAMGVIITVAEPDLLVLAAQVPVVPDWTLIITVAAGVGLFLAAAVLRILFQIRLSTLLTVLYAGLMLLAFFVPKSFLAVAFDSGGVTTGPITVPFIMAMGVGLASVRSDKTAADDSFGLVALSSVGPILAVLLLGIFFKPGGDAAYSAAAVPTAETTQDVARIFLTALPRYCREVFGSLLPVLLMFAVFQALTRRYHGRQLLRMLLGMGYTCLGLVLFLCGVNIGFSPVGALLGHTLASSQWKWLLIPIGMLIGYCIVKAEPAIQVLNHQVESVTNGAISARSMNRCLSIGVSVSVGLAMLRVLTGLSILWILLPGYVLSLVLARLVPPIFVGIAFDSGGVASGPMATTFLLPLSLGACEALGGHSMADAFGVVALVALTPLIAIQIMGVRYGRTQRRLAEAAKRAAVTWEDDTIIELEVCSDDE